jgi:hypothetical protein
MSDYLWDGSGEPDPEVQHLERILGELRHPHHQEPPALPAYSRKIWHVNFSAAAAALIFIALCIGLWQNLSSDGGEDRLASRQTITEGAPSENQTAHDEDSPREQSPSESFAVDSGTVTNASGGVPPRNSTLGTSRRSLHAGRRIRHERVGGDNRIVIPPRTTRTVARTPPNPAAQDERVAGEEARAQVMLALRITSAKLNLAQRRISEGRLNATTNFR